MLTLPTLQADLYHSVIVIPILLLWGLKIKLQQKLAVGLSLCLSIIMIITAIVQISGIHTPAKNFDATWGIFWQFMEACIAVIMVSLTTFRSLFVAHGSAVKLLPHKPNLRKQQLSSRTVAGKKRAGGNAIEDMGGSPELPRVTLTEMRTFIWGGRVKGSVMESEGSGENEISWPLEDESADQTIRAERGM